MAQIAATFPRVQIPKPVQFGFMKERRLHLSLPQEGEVKIWQMDPDGSNQVPITSFLGDIWEFSISPDEKKNCVRFRR